MKKYKHKTSGIIAEENNHFMCYTIKHERLAESLIDRKIIENSNDWEEVKEEIKISNLNVKEEPNYLITAFRFKGDGYICKIQPNGYYEFISDFSLREMLNGPCSVKDGTFEIYSVKNSKGEEFTIGDNVFYLPKQNIELFKIDNFFINRDGILLARSSKESSATCEDINTVTKEIKVSYKPKQPIYTTTDGVDIKEDSCLALYLVNKELDTLYTVGINSFSKEDAEVASRYLTFTSEENRDKYIKENTKKSIFVSADGKEMFEGYRYYVPQIDSRDRLTGTYLEFITDTRTVSHVPKKFSTKSAAQEYIDNNKPRFSLADIEKSYYLAESSGIGEMIKELKKLGK